MGGGAVVGVRVGVEPAPCADAVRVAATAVCIGGGGTGSQIGTQAAVSLMTKAATVKTDRLRLPIA